MVEAAGEEQKVNHRLTDRETTEAWLTENQIPFHVSLFIFHNTILTLLIDRWTRCRTDDASHVRSGAI